MKQIYKKCPHCGEQFAPKSRRQIFCCRICTNRSSSRKTHERKKSGLPSPHMQKYFGIECCPFETGLIRDVNHYGMANCCPSDSIGACHA